jgi:Ca-activated chloride channel family protein
MKGEKMDVLKNVAIQVMHSLRPQDVFSLVSFSDRSEILIPASYISDRRRLEAQIRMLQPSGGTEIFYGLEAAFNEIQRNVDTRRVNHIILVTDGHTYGDEQECLELAERAAQEGIGISAMGIGKEWNDVFLDKLTSRTGGGSKYISKPDDIHRFLLEKFDTLSRILADDVILEFSGTPGAELTYAFRAQPEAGPLPVDSPIHLGAVLKDTNLNVLFEYRIAPSLTNQDSIQMLNGSIKLAIAAIPAPMQPVRINFSRAVKGSAGLEPPPATIIQSLGRLTLYRLQEKARAEVEMGQFELAAQHLKQLATNLLEQGERGLARTALIEADNIMQMQSYSEEGRKEIKYGTRSLLMKNQ